MDLEERILQENLFTTTVTVVKTKSQAPVQGRNLDRLQKCGGERTSAAPGVYFFDHLV